MKTEAYSKRYKYIAKRLTLFILICLLLSTYGCKKEVPDETLSLAGQTPQMLTNGDVHELESYFRKTMDYLDVPGASVAIVLHGQIIYAKGFGIKDLNTREPVTPQTILNVGSITKSMTSLMMATMVDDSIFSWDTPIIDILPAIQLPTDELTQKMTMQDLVCNCSGIREQKEWEFCNFHDLDAEDVIENLINAGVPGTYRRSFYYNSNLFSTAGFLASLAAGGTYGDLYNAFLHQMQTRLLNPIGMINSTFSIETVRQNGNYATPYTISLPDKNTPIPLKTECWLKPFAPAAGLWSTAEDMAKYLILQLNGGDTADGIRIVTEENLHYTWDPQVQISLDASYGLGWVNENYHGLRVMYHSGGTAGYTSEMVFLPEASLGIVVLDNQAFSKFPMAARYRILEVMYKLNHSYDSVLRKQVKEDRSQVLQLKLVASGNHNKETVSKLLGTYENDVIGDIEIKMPKDGSLVFDAGEFSSILWRIKIEQNTYIFTQGLWIGRTFTFVTPITGLVRFVVAGDEGTYTFTKKE